MPDHSSPIIASPASYLAPQAVAFGALGASATIVDHDHPLPVTRGMAASGLPPLAASTAASIVAGPYRPALDRPIILSLSGNWSGTVQMLRSTDGGSTQLPLTVGGAPWGVYTGNTNEPIWEETEAGAIFYLQISLASGMITYRVAQ